MRITVKKETFDVESNYDHTLLKTTVAGQEVAASTLPLLVKEIERMMAVPKSDIPVYIVQEPSEYAYRGKKDQFTYTPATLTGVHAGNNNLLIRLDNSKTIQATSYGSKIIQRITQNTMDELMTLYKAMVDARDAYTKAIKAITIDETTGRKLIKEYHQEREKKNAAKK